MAESLNVIALISGGKDSFYSLYHCLQNGHKVVALGNLCPAPPKPMSSHAEENEDEHDLNSFMYQTVGHTVIPLYEKALGIPLYREEIVGIAVQTGTSYGIPVEDDGGCGPDCEREEDETESLVPLLKRIMAAHPEANTLSTGAILSTYQRTRIESVALRLGLTPLGYLWQYPILPPGTQISLLEDMEDVGLDARIVKVASGGLDESFLWQNVADSVVYRRIEKSMKRFGTGGDGALLGEGGEFETLVVDGPGELFKGRIVVNEEVRKVVREGGGSAWLKILDATVVMKESTGVLKQTCRVPDLLEARFREAFDYLNYNSAPLASSEQPGNPGPESESSLTLFKPIGGHDVLDSVLYWTFTASNITHQSLATEASHLVDQIRQRLHRASQKPENIISTVIILRSMADFVSINTIYGALFPRPNPPARVTISCGLNMPKDTNIIIYLKVHNTNSSLPLRRALHVKCRSYWAPANIGPYSQAISIPLPTIDDQCSRVWTVAVAGQIPLVPHTMCLPSSNSNYQDPLSADNPDKDFNLQTVLSLQHLWRIGLQMGVSWWTSAVAYLPHEHPSIISSKASIAGNAWLYLHTRDRDDDDVEEEDNGRDLWEEKHFAGMANHSANADEKKLPDWETVVGAKREVGNAPPFFAAEVEDLPRGAGIEWHAHMGIVGGVVNLYTHKSKTGWSIHQCVFGNAAQSLIMVEYTALAAEGITWLEEALGALGLDDSARSSASYADTSIPDISSLDVFGGLVPCRSLWDSSSGRLTAVLIFESYFSISGDKLVYIY